MLWLILEGQGLTFEYQPNAGGRCDKTIGR